MNGIRGARERDLGLDAGLGLGAVTGRVWRGAVTGLVPGSVRRGAC
jgi:hypothetical protein